ncbi:carbon-nitrogen hydrolase family protein [Alterisphingorhabdus coralli]|uniref:Carbon-nitrogen hydrolase family protein n=1 Tax=Alterisphingorhabdus coralli TaxID=3071408 RepID=A0AA97I1Z7_9SPHN|nr:carbon-nitrogen hydrolase family protein [Parasphingorhabdus sp. SCSIO 66989]WOE76637.1 carbon-nitrogen hydrolase family protein [Parasphingorhabdus sp. SCSIO 66989]
MHRIAVLQMTSGIDWRANAKTIDDALQEAASGGAGMVFTPEMSGLLDRKRSRATPDIVAEKDSAFISEMQRSAAQHGIWLALGSHPVLHVDGKWRNRSLLIDDKGQMQARYDKIHLFDVTLGNGDDWRESAVYGAGEEVVTAETPAGLLGLTICYDIRFPELYRALALRQPDIITIPAAFTVPTGKAHWSVLVRARAIEAQAFVVAAAQCGSHEDGRSTYGHSMVVDPWGEVLLEMDDQPGLALVDLDMSRIAAVREKLPALANARNIGKGMGA